MTGAESTSVYDACTILLDRYIAETLDSVGFAWDVRDLVMEAKILLVCEQLQSQISRYGRLEDLSSLEDQMSDDLFSIDDLVEVVRQRLFEKTDYSNRLNRVGSIFSQLSRADCDRTKIRPARIRNRVKRN
jgi:hypothetical protein